MVAANDAANHGIGILMRRVISPFVSAALAWAAACGPALATGPGAPAAPRPTVTPQQIDRAIARAVKFLSDRIGPDGRCTADYPPADRFHGGRTALSAYALQTAGVREDDPVLRRATNWLVDANLSSVYSVSFRACALAASREANVLPRLAEDVRWLVAAASGEGRYSYEPSRGNGGDTFDNCNAHAAVMAVAAGASRGVPVPPEYWKKMERYWADQQQQGGGWGYRTLPGVRKVKTYGSMTAAGLEAMLVCFDRVRAADFAECKESPQYRPVEEGLAWLGRNFSVRDNPGLGDNRLYYYLHGLSRVGTALGYKYIGSRDWYALLSAELVARQDSEGAWGYGDVADTAFALMALASGRHAVAFSKLSYPGRWNCRPRDLANLTLWLTQNFERTVTWQIVDANSPLADFGDAPILYISGAGPIDLSSDQIDKVRAYVQRGGMIVSEAAGNSGDFSLDVQRLLGRLFPQYPLRRLADDHPAYNAHFTPKVRADLMGVSNGVRLLAVHSPRDLSLGLQLGAGEPNQPWFELSANLLFQATDKMPLPLRGDRVWASAARAPAPPATVRVARIRHAGNCDPEPLAWERLGLLVGAEHPDGAGRLRLEVSEPMEAGGLDANRWPLAVIVGTEDPNLSADELSALRKYLLDGGTLLADAAGGSRTFGQWVEKDVLTLLPRGAAGPIVPEHAIYRTPSALGRALYRRNYAIALGRAAAQPHLMGVQTAQGRLAVIYSPEDLSCAAVGYGGYSIRGYTPDAAVRLVTNILFHVGGVKAPSATTR